MPSLTEFFSSYFLEFSFFLFLNGACVGSFLNVCVWRIPRKESLLTPPSHCISCNYEIKSYENIPIFSWFFLGGKCSNCGIKISIRYVVLELITGLLFVWVWYCICRDAIPLSMLIPFLFIIAALLVVTITDLEYHIIPNKITVSGLFVAVFWGILFPSSHSFPYDPENTNTFRIDLLTELMISNFFIPFFQFKSSPRTLAIFDILFGVILPGSFLIFVKYIGECIWGRRTVRKKKITELVLEKQGLKEGSKDLIPWDFYFRRRKNLITITGKIVRIALSNKTKPSSISLNNPAKEKDITINHKEVRIDSIRIPLREIDRLRIQSKKWRLPQNVLGLGDIKFIVMLGAFLGPTAAMIIILISSIIGSSIGFFASLVTFLKSQKFTSSIPYGPFISLATIIYIHFGPHIMKFLIGNWLEN